jgi:hypothetical protein
MGVLGFMSPFIRDDNTMTNTSIHDLLHDHPTKNRIGLDMSIIVVSSLMSQKATNLHNLFHSDPKVPIPKLSEKVVNQVRQFITTECTVKDKNGKQRKVQEDAFEKVFCVFDGATHSHKKRHAHQSRYSSRNNKKKQLQELYAITSFPTKFEEEEALEKVKKLRASLMYFRPDLLHDVIESLKKTFGDKVVMIGAPFEADHQLVTLFNLNIIDYVYSNDSDLSCCGADLITNLKPNGKCWLMPFKTLLETRLPSKFNTTVKPWTRDILHYVCSYLGNDYLEKPWGQSVSKVKDFVHAITNEDGGLKSRSYIYNYILNHTLVPTQPKSNKPRKPNPNRDKWYDNQYRKNHMKLWFETQEMFEHGPVFWPYSTNDSVPIRDAILNGNYEVDLGSMMHGTNTQSWSFVSNPSNATDNEFGRDLLLGFNPEEELRDQLSMRHELEGIEREENKLRLVQFYYKCFQLDGVWCKEGRTLEALPNPLDVDGNLLFHGAVLNFEKVPPLYCSYEQLSFWLANRQVKLKNEDKTEAIRMIEIIRSRMPDLKPIPKVLLRGRSGYVEPELLDIRDGTDAIEWKEGDDFLKLLKNSFKSSLNESEFYDLFGKRNGSRMRVQRHVEGGSFDLKMMKGTLDLRQKLKKDRSLLVITAACVPSQKLTKDGGGVTFHTTRLVIELDENKKFRSFLKHPLTYCGCPNGCIVCSHIGSVVLVCHVICRLMNRKQPNDHHNHTITFNEICNAFHPPVNEVLKVPMPVHGTFVNSNLKQNENARRKRYNNKRRKQRLKQRNGNNVDSNLKEDEDDGLVVDEEEDCGNISLRNDEYDDELDEFAKLGRYKAIDGIMDASDTPPYQLVSKINTWADSLTFDNKSNDGSHFFSAERSRCKTEQMKELKNSKGYRATQIVVMDRVHEKLLKYFDSKTGDDGKKLKDRPIILPMLKVTKTKRDKMKAELVEELSCVDLKVTVPLQQELDNND